MKNFYSLNPGEFFTAEELSRKRKDLEIYFPIKDIGADFLTINSKTRRTCRIQVKESRYFGKEEPGYLWHSWHTVSIKKLKQDTADIFIFITYVPVVKGHKTSFKQEYIVIPRKTLLNICLKQKKLTKHKDYVFYFSFDVPKKIREIRDGKLNFTKYHNNWDLI